MRSLIGDEYIGTFPELFELFMNDQFWMGPWWNHVNEFTSLEHVHIIHYEDLLEVSGTFNI